VVANNFYGATTLAIFSPILVWSVWVGERRAAILWRGGGIVLFAYGLAAFLLTPSYLRLTLLDLKWVSMPGNLLSLIVILTAVALFGVFSWRLGKQRPEREWSIFVTGAAVIFGVYVLGFYYFG